VLNVATAVALGVPLLLIDMALPPERVVPPLQEEFEFSLKSTV
jgi:hypothetical protein